MLLSGQIPFRGKNVNEIFAKIKEGKVSFDDDSWTKVSKEGKDFVNNLLVVDVKKRFSVNQCLDH